MFCTKCGQWNGGGATQCTACGAALLPPGVAETYAPPQPSSATVPAPFPGPAPVGSGAPPSYAEINPSSSPLPTYSPLPTGASSAPYGYHPGYAAQIPQTAGQCKVCGAMIPYGAALCPVCLVPAGLIANPADPTVTTYLDARALTQPGTSPIYAAPGAYVGPPPDSTPEELKKGWNWGAALNSTLWSFTHRAAGWGLLCGFGLFCWICTIVAAATASSADLRSAANDSSAQIVSVMLISVGGLTWLFKTLYLGFQGNAIAWRSGRYPNPSRLRMAQKLWARWSIVVFLLGTILLTAGLAIAGGR